MMELLCRAKKFVSILEQLENRVVKVGKNKKEDGLALAKEERKGFHNRIAQQIRKRRCLACREYFGFLSCHCAPPKMR